MLLLLPLLLAPLARAEARAPDAWQPTRGYTSLPAHVAGDLGRLLEGRVDVWLRGEHATLRARYRMEEPGAGPGTFALRAGWREGSGAWKGVSEPGAFPTLLLEDPGYAPLERLPPVATPIPALGFLPPHEGVAHRWRWTRSGRKDDVREVLWTVPYAGDTYQDGHPLDCSCGEPWNLHVVHTWFALDVGRLGFAAGSAPIEVAVRNLSGAALDVWRGSAGEGRLEPGAERILTVDPAAEADDVRLFSFLEGWRPGLGEHAKEREYWKSRSSYHLEVATAETEDGFPEPDPARPWTLIQRVRQGVERRATRVVPQLLRRAVPAGPERWDADGPLAWFAAGLYREAVNGEGPAGYAAWPAFEEDGRRLRVGASTRDAVDPAGWSVVASSSLEGHGVERLQDGRPGTAWCEGAAGDGRGERLTIDVAEPVRFVGIVPGYVRTPWVYAANGVPELFTVRVDERVVWRGVDALADSTLYGEGMRVETIDLGQPVRGRIEIDLASVRPGRYAGDACISEIVLLE